MIAIGFLIHTCTYLSGSCCKVADRCLRSDCGGHPGLVAGQCCKGAIRNASDVGVNVGSRLALGSVSKAAVGSVVRVGIGEGQLGAAQPAHIGLANRAPLQAAISTSLFYSIRRGQLYRMQS